MEGGAVGKDLVGAGGAGPPHRNPENPVVSRVGYVQEAMIPIEGKAVRSDRLVGVVRPEQRAVDPDRVSRTIPCDAPDLTRGRVRNVQIAGPVLPGAVGEHEA